MTNYPRVGVGVMVIRDNKILLGLRHSDPDKASSELHGEGTWSMPGGKVDWHQTIEESARRELEEETSLKANRMKLISVTDEIVHDNHFVTNGFICTDFEGDVQVMEPDEIVEWRWFGLSELPQNLFPPCLKIVKNFFSNEIYKH
ncbi:MAG: NUDIX domain-containing protein [archaeon]|nr:NUDIX domain-containing protein [Nanoarchaeota archaeon]